MRGVFDSQYERRCIIANLISIVISAADNASSVLKGVTGTLDTVANSAIGIGTALTAATAPIAGFFATALKQASDQETALSQLNAVIKSTGGVAGVTAQMADELSSSLSKVTRFSDDAILSAENLALTFTNISQAIFPDTIKTALDMSTALNQDLKSSVLQLGKALQSPVEGITALRRVGVNFTNAQQDMIKGLVQSGNLLGAQKLILQELNTEFGHSAEAAGRTFAGALDITRNKLGELQERIGFALMPTVSRLTGVIGNVIDKVTDWVDKNPALTKTILAISTALIAAGPILIAVGTAIKLVTAETGAFKIALTALSGPVGIVLAALAALGLAYSTNAFGIKDALQPVLDQLGKGFKAVGDAVGLFVARLKEGGIAEALSGVFSVFEDGSSTISTLLQSFGVLPSTADSVANSLSKAFDVIKPGIKIAQDAVEYFVKGFTVNLNDLLFHAGYIFNGIRGALETAFNNVSEWVTLNVVDPLKGIWVLVQPEVQKVIDWFNNDFLTAVQQVSGWIDTNVIVPLEGIWTQIQPILKEVADFVTELFKPVKDFIDGILNAAADTIEILRRLGDSNYKPQRTLKLLGETEPGVVGQPGGSNPNQVIPVNTIAQNLTNLINDLLGKSGLTDPNTLGLAIGLDVSAIAHNIEEMYAFGLQKLTDATAQGITTQLPAAHQAGVDFGTSLITDGLIPTGNILFQGIGTLKQPAFLAGVGPGKRPDHRRSAAWKSVRERHHVHDSGFLQRRRAGRTTGQECGSVTGRQLHQWCYVGAAGRVQRGCGPGKPPQGRRRQCGTGRAAASACR
jgi:hypothetical protein